jgi:hypothetical protein
MVTKGEGRFEETVAMVYMRRLTGTHALEQLSAEPILANLPLAIAPLFDDRLHQAQTAPVTCGKPDQSLAHTNRT